jgi:lipopolysaccharide transport system ATP-binding protein
MSSYAIRAVGLSKQYQVYDRPHDRIVHMFKKSDQNFGRVFHALHDVSFQVARGETVALIGRNGSGKSTLLQILAGTLHPSAGTAEINGRIAALLELGSGFNPEFTGRENVIMNAEILGLSREQINSRMDELIAFAELGSFIDQPVKTYSSGMYVRLAFSVQVFSEPDVLIVDEALSVGDVFFQQKCFAHIRKLRDKGTSLLFVSHDMAAVRNLCDRALLLESGHVVFDGSPDEAVSRYYNRGSKVRTTSGADGAFHLSEGNDESSADKTLEADAKARQRRDDIIAHDILRTSKSRHGSGDLVMIAARLLNEQGEDSFSIALQGEVTIDVLVRANCPIESPSVGIHIYDRMNNLIFAAGTRQKLAEMPALAPGEELTVTLKVRANLQPGEYTLSIGCSTPTSEGLNLGINQDRCEGLGPVQVHTDAERLLPFYGMAELPMTASFC